MGKSSPSPPAPPNPQQTAAAQAAANAEAVRESALVSQINQQTPWGSLTYTGEVGSPNRTATTSLTPQQQAILDLQQRAQAGMGYTANQQIGNINQTLSQPLDFSTLGARPEANEATRGSVADALYERLNPQFDRDLAALETRLANQGIGYGTDAYSAAMDDFNRSRNDARLAVEDRALGQMAQLFGLETSARQQGISEMMTERQAPLNELAAMLSGTQVQGPSFVPTGQYGVQAPDVMGATYGNYNGQMNAYNQQLANQSAQQQGLFGLLGNGAMAAAYHWSDRRLKRNIIRIGRLNGLPLYIWRYVWGAPGIGFMADEVEKVKPEAVRYVNGYAMVDYGALR